MFLFLQPQFNPIFPKPINPTFMLMPPKKSIYNLLYRTDFTFNIHILDAYMRNPLDVLMNFLCVVFPIIFFPFTTYRSFRNDFFKFDTNVRNYHQ